MKRNKNYSLIMLTFLFVFVFALATPVSAKKIDVKDYLAGFGQNTPAQAKVMIQEISGMKKKSNSVYPTLYYTGNHMIIGINSKAVCGSKKPNYIYIENKGNKKVSYYGISIGESKSKVLKKLTRMYYRSYDGGKTYSNCNASSLQISFKNGKLSGFKFIVAPTS